MVAAPRTVTLGSSAPPLIGRTELLDGLKRGLEAAREGHGRVFWLVGETGSGKSSVASALSEEAGSHGMLVLEGRALPRELPQPFESLKLALKGLTPRLLQGSEGGEASLRGLWVPERRPAPTLVPLGLIPWRGDEGTEGPTEAAPAGPERLWAAVDRAGGDVEEDRLVLFERIRQALGTVSRAQSVLLVLEDLQNADAGTLEFLRYLARHLSELPIAVLVTSLPWEGESGPLGETLKALKAEGTVDRETLRPLTMDEVDEYLRWRHAGRRPDPELVTRLFTESEGNPLMLERLAVGERGRGRLSTRDESPGLALGTPAPGAGPGRRGVGTAALDGGNELAGKLLVYGALVGNEFPFAAVARMAGDDEERVASALERLVRRGVLVERSGQEVYAFREMGQREEVLAALTETRRRRLHRRLAEVLEVIGPQPVGEEEWVRELALHFHLGRQDVRSFEYNSQLYGLARPTGRVSEGRSALERALEAVRRLPPEDREYRDQEREVLLQLGECLAEAGELRRSEERLKEAFVLFLPNEPHEAVQIALARTHLHQGKYPEAYRRIEGLVPPAHETSPSPAGIEAAGLLAEIALALGRWTEAQARAEVTLRMAEATPDRVLLGEACRRLGDFYFARGLEPERARALYLRAERVLSEASEPIRLRRVGLQLAVVDALRGRHDDAGKRLDALARWAGNHGARLLEGEVLLAVAHLALEQNLLDRVSVSLIRAREVLPPEEGTRFELQYRLLEGRHAHRRGELDHARFQLTRAESLARGSGVPSALYAVLLASAELEAGRGEAALAKRLLQEAQGIGAGRRLDYQRRENDLGRKLSGS